MTSDERNLVVEHLEECVEILKARNERYYEDDPSEKLHEDINYVLDKLNSEECAVDFNFGEIENDSIFEVTEEYFEKFSSEQITEFNRDLAYKGIPINLVTTDGEYGRCLNDINVFNEDLEQINDDKEKLLDMGQELEMNIDLFIQIIELFNEYDNVQEYTDKFIEHTTDELENDGYSQEEILEHFKELDIETPKKIVERGR